MSYDSCSLLFNNLEKYLSGKISPLQQDNSSSTYASKIKKSETKITWSLSASEINQKIRAFYPYPSMWFLYEGSRFKILKEIPNDKLYREFQVDYESFVGDVENAHN